MDRHGARGPGDDGSWGRTWTTAVTGLACLAFLAGEERPFAGEEAAPLVDGLVFLLRQQKDGVFPTQGHTWIHGQGFATLALSEVYGRIVRDAAQPDLDVPVLKEAVAKAVAAIQAHQSHSGGWWYVPGVPHDHEGSTTVCAVQALVSAANHGFATDAAVLARGFEYLKRCQNPDGGFDYKLGPGTTSMKEGTAAYVDAARKDLVSWQAEDGSFPLQGWMRDKAGDQAYATAYAALFCGVPAKRLSIFHRRPEPLPSPAPAPPTK